MSFEITTRARLFDKWEIIGMKIYDLECTVNDTFDLQILLIPYPTPLHPRHFCKNTSSSFEMFQIDYMHLCSADIENMKQVPPKYTILSPGGRYLFVFVFWWDEELPSVLCMAVKI